METTSPGTSSQPRQSNWNPGGPGGHRDIFGLMGQLVDGRYLVERVVGRGGFGVVYRVQHLRLDSPVALKVLRIPDRLTAGERDEFVRQFLQEGKLLFRLGSIHPTIVRVFEASVLTTADGSIAPYLAMDWLDGITLDRQLRRIENFGLRQLKLTDAMRLLHPIVDSLATAHALGVAHLDVKPGNIFLLERGNQVSPRLLDFGLAKIVGGSAATPDWNDDVTGYGSAMTPAYAAPEQWTSQLGATGPWTDVHALALVCVELLAGSRAFRGPARSQLKMACLDESSRPTPQRLGLSVPAAVEQVFRRALSVDPKARFSDAREFWQALCLASNFTASSSLSIPKSESPLMRQQSRPNNESGSLDPTVLSQSMSGRRGRTSKSSLLTDWRRIRRARLTPESIRWFTLVLAVGGCLVVAFRVRNQSSERARASVAVIGSVNQGRARPALARQSAANGAPIVNTRAAVKKEAPRLESDGPKTAAEVRIDGNRARESSRTRAGKAATPGVNGSLSPAAERLSGSEPGSSPEVTDAKASPRDKPSAADLLHHEALRTRN